MLFLGLSNICLSQEDDHHKQGDKYLSVVTGYNFWNKHFLEIGLAHTQTDMDGPMVMGHNYFLSTEVKIDRDLLIGPKIGIWMGNGVGIGLNAIYYTNFHASSLRFRPEIGFGFSTFKLAYGYNVPLTNKDFNQINKNNISLMVLFQVKKIIDRDN